VLKGWRHRDGPIAGCEAAWAFFGRVFAVLVPGNMSSVIDKANPADPLSNQAFVIVEHAQAQARARASSGRPGQGTTPPRGHRRHPRTGIPLSG